MGRGVGSSDDKHQSESLTPRFRGVEHKYNRIGESSYVLLGGESLVVSFPQHGLAYGSHM